MEEAGVGAGLQTGGPAVSGLWFSLVLCSFVAPQSQGQSILYFTTSLSWGKASHGSAVQWLKHGLSNLAPGFQSWLRHALL